MRWSSVKSLVSSLTCSSVYASGAANPQHAPLPLVVWHGLGDNYNASWLQDLTEFYHRISPSIVYPIRLDEDPSSDRTATFFGNVTEQLDKVCEDLASHPVLSKAPAINAVGFSQGGQFLRGYVERCNNPPVRTLLTFGSQHNGIAQFQKCKPGDWLCKGAMNVLRWNTWSSFVQSRLVPAQYFRNPEELDNYVESSNFLADINNEREAKNPKYKTRLASLEKFVMYLFTEDKTVVPKESAIFAEVNTTSGDVTQLKDRKIYTEDWLGLKELDEKGGLIFDTIEGEHMQFSEDDLVQAFLKYLLDDGVDYGMGDRMYDGQHEL